MKIIIIIASLYCILPLAALRAQEHAKISNAFLETMQGDWKGKLTYTDYQDDSTQVIMDVWLKSNLENEKLIKQFYYKEPDGNTKQKSKYQDTTYIINGGRDLVETGYKLPFKIIEYTTKASEENSSTTVDGVKVKSGSTAMSEHIAVMETIDDDNEKKSTIRTTITTTANSMMIKKEVKYDGTSSFFVRHTFSYIR